MNDVLRTCVGCRATVPAATLLRLVVVDGEVVVDPRRRLPGRGAHLHAGPDCLAAALKRRAVTRALRAPEARTDALVDDPHFRRQVTAP